MRRRAELPPELGPAFTVAEAGAAGVTRRQLDRPDLETRFRGVRMRVAGPSEIETREEAWRAELLRLARGYALRMDGREFFSHATAAVMWGLPITASGVPRPEVSVLHPERAPRSAGIRGHQVHPALASIVEFDGMPVTSPATTWAMLGSTASVPQLVAIGDAVVHVPRHPGGFGGPDPDPLGTPEQLVAAIDAGRRVGIDRLRAALPLIRTGAASRRETELRLHLVASGLPAPELDVDVYDEFGRFLGCSELAYPRYRVAIEYESDHHRVSRRQWDRDIEKQQLYAESGWAMIRVTSRLLIDHPRELRRRVETTLRARGWRPER